MDSFCDVPRRPPVPTTIEKIFVTPVVPEVSTFCPGKTSTNNINTYEAWRHKQTSENKQILTSNKGNIQNGLYNYQMTAANSDNSSQLFKKQVRFESPPLQQRFYQTYEHFIEKTNLQHNATSNVNPEVEKTSENMHVSSKETESPNGTNFKDIYMANIPNRHLDLSVVELPSSYPKENKKELSVHISDSTEINKVLENKENELPKTYREFLEAQKKLMKAQQENTENCDCVTDIFNYKKNKISDTMDSFQIITNDVNRITAKDTIVKPEQTFSPPLLSKPICPPLISPEQNVPRNMPSITPPPTQPNLYLNLIRNNQTQIPQVVDAISSYQNNQANPHIVNAATTEICCQQPKIVNNRDEEPTNRDLLKIIAQQNEQLLLLQKQVAMLLSRDQNHTKPIEAPPQRINNGETCLKTEYPKTSSHDIYNTPRKRGLSKFSVDVMTSFEVAIRPQHNRQNFVNTEPKLQEITEVESLTTERNDKTSSIHLQEPVEVPERCPSPEPSININMNDYDSSDDEVSASEIGATFYHNLMGQVNNILRKAQINTKDDFAARIESKSRFNDKSNKTMHRVKEATLNHLRSIGVTIENLDSNASSQDFSTSSQNDSKDYSPTEISFAVKQLLMKYLPDEHLARAAHRQKQQIAFKNKEETPPQPPIIKARPELSFASVQYLKKYNLIQSADVNHKPGGNQGQLASRGQLRNLENPKILDITALKMQPKLL